MNRTWLSKRLLPLLLIAAGVWQLASASWILVKAELSQYLISRAWERQLHAGEIQKPWPWADTWPVARLKLDQQKPLVVLQGITGEALAFGPGLHEASALPFAQEHAGNTSVRTTVIAAHRDTHFRGLEKLQAGMGVQLQARDGRWQHYRVLGTKVVDSTRETLPISDRPGLLLVTCYPFGSLEAGGPLRYLVYAEPVPDAAVIQL
ncbi:class GN sortase [Microbulbifer agarilyticus]|uniref:class GN sortase n=1 Tax=Microbulbifer agarilyticus TaxID=260552 RepID=UPI001CD4DF4B|nr:class GN sortase [Microbulbifer agarilyticus]MCA0901662.1 class GN sortase [Microbulbifer agarilyticus]